MLVLELIELDKEVKKENRQEYDVLYYPLHGKQGRTQEFKKGGAKLDRARNFVFAPPAKLLRTPPFSHPPPISGSSK